MRITQLARHPVAELPYLNAGPGRRPERARLPLYLGQVAGLPPGLSMLVIASDLQGRMSDDRLLGEALPEWLQTQAQEGLFPDLAEGGMCLCGDLYAKPGSERRGGKGDVRPVWEAFHRYFRWVAGVAGNHDLIGESPKDLAQFRQSFGAGFLDGTMVVLDGLRIAGVGGLIGDPRKPFRRLEGDFLAAFDGTLAHRPDLLLTHDGPDAPDHGQLGIPAVRERLLRYLRPILICRGHAHWEVPLVQLTETCQVLNVDVRVVVLTREGSE